ncbi:winged helix-turn-helix transcriptional regulator [Chitinophaga pinensis]|uniref:Transcriptional regulator, HxlR family n=1 Tax=Chitinophaga pinensis (strain ATCC 43595 / DSM 2588 / LMG 13176 / NBRC 15968 / NCIMB 11800 / UQM 2034) TaxID=485918 RepID=A0A979G9B2_CHIPD|nr:helix-turn-helix domain-containing protein [Chitinophaga pinensis]ACU63091.1 transcriptional regulator, HxlR family [Chitinophaga pinensis DSM 2588]
MYERKIPLDLNCGMAVIMEIIGGKWKPCLIFNISRGIRRPGELQRYNPAATRRVLTQQLKELEEHGIIRRVVYAEVPPKVEYYLTEKGESLMPVINAMENWGAGHLPETLLEQVVALPQ